MTTIERMAEKRFQDYVCSMKPEPDHRDEPVRNTDPYKPRIKKSEVLEVYHYAYMGGEYARNPRNAERFFIGDIICVKLYSHDETVIGRLVRVGDDCLVMDVSEQYSSIMRQIPHDNVCAVHVWDGKEGEKKNYD